MRLLSVSFGFAVAIGGSSTVIAGETVSFPFYSDTEPEPYGHHELWVRGETDRPTLLQYGYSHLGVRLTFIDTPNRAPLMDEWDWQYIPSYPLPNFYIVSTGFAGYCNTPAPGYTDFGIGGLWYVAGQTGGLQHAHIGEGFAVLAEDEDTLMSMCPSS